jgi:hypothetical protein
MGGRVLQSMKENRERSQFRDHSVILALNMTYIVALVRWSKRITRTSRIADDRGASPKEAVLCYWQLACSFCWLCFSR